MLLLLSVLGCIFNNVAQTEGKYPYNKTEYLTQWKELRQLDLSTMVGSHLNLTEAEKNVSKYLHHLKIQEYKKTGAEQIILGTKHFFEYKEYLANTSLFKFFKGLPKGGILHAHDVALVNLDFVIKNITYLPHLYMCRDNRSTPEKITLLFRANVSYLGNCTKNYNWTLLSDERSKQGNATIDTLLKNYMSLVTPDPDVKYPDENTVWMYFERGLFMVVGMIQSEHIFKIYNKKLLEDIYADNVSYIEMRGFLPQLFDLEGRMFPPNHTIALYKNISDSMKQRYPDFMGMTYIVCGFKKDSRQRIGALLNITAQLQQEFGKHFVPGFDLVGEEAKGHPIKYFSDLLISAQQKHNISYFFHAGETGFQGTKVDENLFDTLLLENPRIGHGYALVRHPEVRKQVKESGKVLEICPISNMVLLLLKDLKNHPAVELISQNYTLVISSDDYAAWDTTPLTHDMTLAYLTLLGKHGGLNTMKALIMNSITHSSLSPSDKIKLMNIWETSWHTYMNQTISSVEVQQIVSRCNTESLE